MLFSQIPGLEDTKRTLISSVRNSHIAHAQLFQGREGSANLGLALAYATYINCEQKGEHDSCGECSSCHKFNKLIHPDLHFVFPVSTTKEVSKDALSISFMKHWRSIVTQNPYLSLSNWGDTIGSENKQLNISVDESRNILKSLVLKSFEAEYKILILWLPEMMNASSANAILKVLEEPPFKTIFLLVSNNSDKIITTILSRTQFVKIRSFTDEEIKKDLIGKYSLDEKRAGQLAYLAEGNMNEAVRLKDEIQEDNHQLFRDWMRTCYKRNNLTEMVGWSESFQKIGRESQKHLLQYGLNTIRETFLYRHTGTDILRMQEDELKFVEGFSKVLDDAKIEGISKQLNEAYYHIERNANAKILFMDLSLNISSLMKNG
ncbi:MAG: ATP-binding protein [Cytophagaceae bacterium]